MTILSVWKVWHKHFGFFSPCHMFTTYYAPARSDWWPVLPTTTRGVEHQAQWRHLAVINGNCQKVSPSISPTSSQPLLPLLISNFVGRRIEKKKQKVSPDELHGTKAAKKCFIPLLAFQTSMYFVKYAPFFFSSMVPWVSHQTRTRHMDHCFFSPSPDQV